MPCVDNWDWIDLDAAGTLGDLLMSFEVLHFIFVKISVDETVLFTVHSPRPMYYIRKPVGFRNSDLLSYLLANVFAPGCYHYRQESQYFGYSRVCMPFLRAETASADYSTRNSVRICWSILMRFAAREWSDLSNAYEILKFVARCRHNLRSTATIFTKNIQKCDRTFCAHLFDNL